MENNKSLKIIDCYFETKKECTDVIVNDANTILQCKCNGKEVLLKPDAHFDEDMLPDIASVLEGESVIVFFDEDERTIGRYVFNGQSAYLQLPSWNELTVNGAAGVLDAYPSSDSEYPGIFICFTPNGCDNEVNVAVVEVTDNVNLYCYTDEYSDDWTHKYVLDAKKIVDSFDDKEE